MPLSYPQRRRDRATWTTRRPGSVLPVYFGRSRGNVMLSHQGEVALAPFEPATRWARVYRAELVSPTEIVNEVSDHITFQD